MSPELPITSTTRLLHQNGGDGPKSKSPIPDHELIRCIGKGAYGEVWLARNVFGAHRAVKVVRKASFRDERTYEREFRGIQSFEPISRTNDGLLDILQAGRNDDAGYYYYVMELADDLNADCGTRTAELPGAASESVPHSALRTPHSYTPHTLQFDLQRRGRLPVSECVQLGLNLTLALGHLHRHGLIHRDIKPANIIFVRGIPKLADIGLVTNFDDTCSFVGTEGFIAPEGPTSPRADLFSLGKVLYEMSTGRDRKDFPEPATGFGERSDEQEAAELNAVVLKACATDPQDRYQTAEEFHADLALLNSGKSVKWKRVVEKRLAFARKAGAVVAVLAALATGGYLFQRHQTREAIRLQRHAEELVARMQIQNAENLFARGDSSLALAHFAQVLRRHPDNRVAAERIMAALTQRSFPRLVTKPLLHEAKFDLNAHQSPARFSPDGQRVITGSEDGTVRLWNVQTGQETIPPYRHSGPVFWVEFSPDGQKILSASQDRRACLLDARTGTLIFPPLQHDGHVDLARFDPSGRFIATAAAASMVRIYSAETGQLLYPPLAHDGEVNSIVFSPDGRWLATASEDKTVRIWEVRSGQLKERFQQDGPARLVQFSPDGKWLAVTVQSDTWQVQVWAVESGRPVRAPLLHQNRLYTLEFSPDSQRLVTATANKTARVWQVATGEELFQLHHSAIVYSAAFSPDGREILTASVDQTARLWDAATGAAISEPMLHDGRVIHGEFSSIGEHVLTAASDKTVKVWNVRPMQPASKILQHDAWVILADFDATGERAVTATGDNLFTANGINRWNATPQNSIAIWDVTNGTPRSTLALGEDAEPLVIQFTVAGSKALVATRTNSRRALVRELETGTMMAAIQHKETILCGHFSADGYKLVTGSRDNTARIWDVRRGVELTPPLAHKRRVNSVHFSSNSQTVVTASSDGTAILWDASTGRRVTSPLAHGAEVWFAQFNSRGDKVVTTALDQAARIWSTNGELIATLKHSAPVEYAEFSPDGDRVITASGDRTARLWSAVTGAQLTEPLQHSEVVLTARFSPDGLRVITASMDRTAQVWDAATGLKLSDPLRHDDWVVSARFNADGRRAITASVDGTAKIWEVLMAASPIPTWLPELAEALGGQRLNADRIPEPVSWSEYAELKGRLKSAGPDRYIEWAKRFFDE